MSRADRIWIQAWISGGRLGSSAAELHLKCSRDMSRDFRALTSEWTFPRSAAPVVIRHASTLIVVQLQGRTGAYRATPTPARIHLSYTDVRYGPRLAAVGAGGDSRSGTRRLRPVGRSPASPPGLTRCARPPGGAISRSDHTRH